MTVTKSPASRAAPIPQDKQRLLQLAERCESEEPSRDLDLAIYYATRDPSFTGPVPEGFAKPYTTSLDSAVTLVPEEMDWQVGKIGPIATAGIYTFGDTKSRFHVKCKTQALALCAVSLKARAAPRPNFTMENLQCL